MGIEVDKVSLTIFLRDMYPLVIGSLVSLLGLDNRFPEVSPDIPKLGEKLVCGQNVRTDQKIWNWKWLIPMEGGKRSNIRVLDGAHVKGKLGVRACPIL